MYIYICLYVYTVCIYIWVSENGVYPKKRTFIGVNNDTSWDFGVPYFQTTPI